MVNYGNGKIYKIERLSDNCVVYVGSTTKKYLSSRLVEHKNMSIAKPNRKVYKCISDNDGWENHQILLIKQYSCNSKDELKSEEARFMRCLKPLGNKSIPMRTPKEYYSDNVDKISNRSKQYRAKNAMSIKQYKITYRNNNAEKMKLHQLKVVKCSCGKNYTFGHQSRHFKSKKHINSIPVQFKLIEEMHNNRKIYIPQPLPTLI